MISIIVPVYNVEPYLRKCLDSIISQTYRDLEILIIDDGSTDGSGNICDEYKCDDKVRVFHTINKGLSAARNLGLDEAKGEWIGFVDSDDWIEPDMYEVLLERAIETGSDIVECGIYREFPNRVEEVQRDACIMSGSSAVKALLHEKLSDTVWNKLWSNRCFIHFSYPEGRVFEDIATTYHIFGRTKSIATTERSMYHHLQRYDSLSRLHDLKSLTDYWYAHKERYQNLRNSIQEQKLLLKYCSAAVARTWAYYYDCTNSEKDEYSKAIREMNRFVREQVPLFGYSDWSKVLRVGSVFPHFLSPVSFHIAWMANRIAINVNKKRETCEKDNYLDYRYSGNSWLLGYGRRSGKAKGKA